MFLQQMTELAQCRLIRHALCKEVDTGEFPHGIAVINCVFRCRVRQMEPYLEQVHPQHFLDPHWRTASFPLGIVGRNDAHPLLPWDDVFHNLQKLFSLRFLLAPAVLHIRKCFLVHFKAPP